MTIIYGDQISAHSYTTQLIATTHTHERLCEVNMDPNKAKTANVDAHDKGCACKSSIFIRSYVIHLSNGIPNMS